MIRFVLESLEIFSSSAMRSAGNVIKKRLQEQDIARTFEQVCLEELGSCIVFQHKNYQTELLIIPAFLTDFYSKSF